MTEIQRLCKFFNELPEDDFSSHNWSSWAQLPATKCFFDYILKSRLETMNDTMNLNNSNLNFEYFYSQGRFKAFGELVDLILNLTGNKKEEK